MTIPTFGESGVCDSDVEKLKKIWKKEENPLASFRQLEIFLYDFTFDEKRKENEDEQIKKYIEQFLTKKYNLA